jgi:hypothetical protein
VDGWRALAGGAGALRRTAYHEVGHALAADEFDLLRGSPSIIPDLRDGTAGRVYVEGIGGPAPGANRAVWAMRQSVIDYAGHAAVVALLGRGTMSDRSAGAHGAGGDFARARERLGGNPVQIERAKRRALAIVRAHRKQAMALAELLFVKGRLRHLAAVTLGRLGGLARAATLAPERRSEIARKHSTAPARSHLNARAQSSAERAAARRSR